jgi:hypothetical protein
MRTIVLVDGQNLFHLAKRTWGNNAPYTWPSYDVQKLAVTLVSRVPGRSLAQVHFYTGVPDRRARPSLYRFWHNKLNHLQGQGVVVYQGRISSGDQEKGVDVRLALDLIRATYEKRYETAIIVSQDADFGPAVSLSKEIAHAQGRTLDFESAFPFSPGKGSRVGIPDTNWVHIDKAMYDACLDLTDYRT